MKTLFALIVAFASFSSVKSQNALPEEIKLVNEIFISARNGHYYRAERLVSELRWTLKVKGFANKEDYKTAYKLNDSVKYYKNNPVPLDMSKAALVETDEALEKQIKNQIKLIRAGKYKLADVYLGELKIKLKIKESKENMQEEKAVMQQLVLDTYKKQNELNYKSIGLSICINENKIDSISKELEKPETATNDSIFSILQQELELREKLKKYVDNSQYLSASMDYRKLESFLKNPQPKSNKPASKFVPVTDNQKRIVWLEKKMMTDKQEGKYINLWPMTQEHNLRSQIETAIKKGKTKDVQQLEFQIKQIQFK